MLLPQTPTFRKHRGGFRLPPAGAPGPAVALTLVAATWEESPSVTLVFDRPVDVSGLDVALVRVDIGPLGSSYVGYQAPIVVSPTTVQILLSGVGDYPGPGVVLNAPADTGIVAADDGGTWAGVADLSLPFP
jgi:hypothetical protein